MILERGVEVPDRFVDIVLLHITKHALNAASVPQPRILGIHGPSGEGKTYQCEAVFRSLGLSVFRFSGQDFESPRSGEPARALASKYADACETIARGTALMSVLFVNDIDAGIGSWGPRVQYTVNTQTLIATLMHIADDIPLSRSDAPRAPVVVTGNDFSCLYQPLARLGRMTFFEWRAMTSEKVLSVQQLFSGWRFPESELRDLVLDYKDQPIVFFAQLQSRLHDGWLLETIKSVGILELLDRIRRRNEGVRLLRSRHVSMAEVRRAAEALKAESILRSHLPVSETSGVQNG